MMPLLVGIAVGVYATLGVVLWIALNISKLRRLGGPPPPEAGSHFPHTALLSRSGNFAVWEWREARWRLASDNLPPGVDPGPPPGYPGAFEGETIKTWVRSG